MSAIGWILYAATMAVCVVIGWGLRSWWQEVLDFRADEQRDAKWDAEHGVRRA